MTSFSLTFKAGAGALESVRRHGFDIASIGTIAGASGGAKWLVLSKLDRAIHASIVPRLEGPVHLVGSSIGAWRLACYAQADPVAAIERFERAYLEQSYSDEPDIHEITAVSREILGTVLGEHGVEEILENPLFRLHILAVRSRAAVASERRPLLATALLLAALLNVASRSTLGWFFERALFYDRRDRPPFFDLDGFPLQRIELTPGNLEDAVAASGSIPLVLAGVRDIEGAAHGIYRDGGIIDYHLDLPHSADEKLTLYPHFYGHIVPGWFDKMLGWRKPLPRHIDRTILVSPSDEFVSRLPYGKIPDRHDFVNLEPAERVRAWRQCVTACDALADEFLEVVEKEQLAARLESL